MSLCACVHTLSLHLRLSRNVHAHQVCLAVGKFQCNGSQGMLAIPLFTMGPALAVVLAP